MNGWVQFNYHLVLLCPGLQLVELATSVGNICFVNGSFARVIPLPSETIKLALSRYNGPEIHTQSCLYPRYT